MNNLSPLLQYLGEQVASQENELFQAAAKAMPMVMFAVLEELRGIPDALLLAAEFVSYYRQPTASGLVGHVNYEGEFTHFEYKAPIPEIVLRTRIYMNSRRNVRTVSISTLSLRDLHKLAEHLAVDTTFETYIGPYPWDQNWILKRE